MRSPALIRTLRALPSPFLFALRKAIEDNQDDLAPGALYRQQGGCVVGVMLQTIFPSSFDQPSIVWLLRRLKRRSIYDDFTGLAREEIRLGHLEMIFDNATQDACRAGLNQKEAAKQVGLQFLSEINHELIRRSLVKSRAPRLDLPAVVC